MEVNTEIVVATIAAVAGLSSTGLSLLQRKKVGEMHSEVKNTHDTNLRDDVDRVLDKLDTVIDGQVRHDGEIAGLREDQRQEREERIALAARVDNERRRR